MKFFPRTSSTGSAAGVSRKAGNTDSIKFPDRSLTYDYSQVFRFRRRSRITAYNLLWFSSFLEATYAAFRRGKREETLTFMLN
ncbi:MAG: hypothetical protein WBL40_14760, partial [Terrimicrobiaceae bacterium]